MSYIWNAKAHRYTDASGKAVSDKQLRFWLESAVDSSRGKVARLTEQFNAGKIDLPTWVTRSQAEWTRANIAAAEIAAGGRAQIGPKQLGRLGNRIKQLNGLWKERWLAVENGAQLKDRTLVARAASYVDAAIGTFEGIKRGEMIDVGMKEEMRVLGGSKHCSDCPSLAGRWEPIGTLPAISDTQCLSACRCSFQYR